MVVDPRREHGRDYPLVEVLFVAVVGVLCGADGWVGVELVCSGMVPWLRRFSAFEHGVPSHDTLGRVFRLLRPETLAEVLAEATERLFRAGADRHVAVDGKMARRSFTDGDRNSGMHMVTAWATTSTASTTSGGATQRWDRSARSTSRPRTGPPTRPSRWRREREREQTGPSRKTRPHPYWHLPRRSGWSSPEPTPQRKRTDPPAQAPGALPHPGGHNAKNLGGRGQSSKLLARISEQAYSTKWSGKSGEGQSRRGR
mgnify:CR=1 FL=1